MNAEPSHRARSPILDILGGGGFAAVTAVRVPGRVVWLNRALAREMGLPEDEDRLVAMFSVRALRRGEALDGREPVPMYADQYGGSDILPCRGAGRSAFLGQGNFYLKGIGHTPLYRRAADDDFQHTHGGFSLRESMFEAMFGEVNAHLLTHGSARIVAIVDQGQLTVHPDGMEEARAIAVRVGEQLRPAHVFAHALRSQAARLERFLAMTRATGQLVARPAPDLAATMLRIIDDHALTSAELFRWRMFHGAISMSNMEMSGAMLDTTTQSAQPRTAPLKILTYHSDANIVYGREHLQRAHELELLYRAVTRGIPHPKVGFAEAMSRAYAKHLQLQMLTATGLRIDAARRIVAELPAIARRMASVLLQMAALRNAGSVNANQITGEETAVLDVFNLLRHAPQVRLTPSRIRAFLAPAGPGAKRLQVARLIDRFARTYDEFTAACAGIAPGHYGSAAELRRSMTFRAESENRPLDALYRCHILSEFREAVDAYRRTNDPRIIAGILDERIAASRRRVGGSESDASTMRAG